MARKILLYGAIAAVVLFILLIASAFNPWRKEVWVGYYFPKHGEETYELTPHFVSRKECVDWIKSKEPSRKLGEGSFDYWCGMNCDETKFSFQGCEVMSNEDYTSTP